MKTGKIESDADHLRRALLDELLKSDDIASRVLNSYLSSCYPAGLSDELREQIVQALYVGLSTGFAFGCDMDDLLTDSEQAIAKAKVQASISSVLLVSKDKSAPVH